VKSPEQKKTNLKNEKMRSYRQSLMKSNSKFGTGTGRLWGFLMAL
jgi:hypothetical protein